MKKSSRASRLARHRLTGAVLPALFTFTAACGFAVSNAQASVSVDWTFSGDSVSTTYTGPYSADSSSGFSSATVAVSGSAGNANTEIANFGDSPDTHNLRIQNGTDPTLTFTLTTSTAANLLSLTFDDQVSGGALVNNIAWSYSINGGSFQSLGNTAISSTQDEFLLNTLSLSGLSSLSSGTTIVFDGVLSGESGNSVIDFDNFDFSGTAIPEPVNCALPLFGLIAGVGTVGHKLCRKLATKAA
jgi:outer membrane lipopolysaccharide assembly protein LptE/RlpB